MRWGGEWSFNPGCVCGPQFWRRQTGLAAAVLPEHRPSRLRQMRYVPHMSHANGHGMDDPQMTRSADRLAALRAELARQGLDGFIVPRADEHLGEYVPAGAERL